MTEAYSLMEKEKAQMSGNGTQRKRSRDFIFFILLLAAAAAARCILSVTAGAAGATRDGTLNLELAQNIRLYGRLTVYGLRTNYAGILYPALLSPLFGIGDPEARMRAVYILNALLVSSAMIPAWMTCRKLLKREGQRMAATALFALAPDLWLSVTGMAENLFIPLAMWGIWFLVRAFEKGAPDLRTACGLGLWTYLLFITSGSGIAAAGGALALFAYEAAAGKDSRKTLTGCLGFAAAFAAAYLAVMAALYGGRLYFYPELACGKITTPGQLLFWLYAGLCALLWFCAGTLFLPVLIPAGCRKRQDAEQRRLTLFGCVYAALAAAMTAYAVSVSEDFSRMDIRIVLRAFIPAAWLFAVLFLAAPESGEAKPVFRHPLVRAAAWLAVLCALFLRVPGSAGPADAPALRLFGKLDGGTAWMIALRAAAAALIAAGTVLWIRKRQKAVTAGVLAALMILGAVNGVLTLREAGQEAFSAGLAEQAQALGNSLAAADGKVLVISADPGSETQRLMDTYCDTDYCLIEKDALTRMAIDAEEPGMIPAEGQAWTEGEKAGAFHYAKDTEDGIGQVSYIVCPEGELTLTGGQYRDCTPEGVSFVRVYRNENPGRVDALDLFMLRPWDEIAFTKEHPDFLQYPVSGFSQPESGFTWTEGSEAEITLIPAAEEGGPLDLYWRWKMTIGEQPYAVYAGETLLTTGTANGTGDELIEIPEELTGNREPITFRFVFPEARQPDNGDPRVLAVAFEAISLID